MMMILKKPRQKSDGYEKILKRNNVYKNGEESKIFIQTHLFSMQADAK